MSGGLHAVVQFSVADRDATRVADRTADRSAADAAEQRVVAACDAAGLGAVALSGYWRRRDPGDGLFGLIIGTGGPYETATEGSSPFEVALDELRAILLAHGPATGAHPSPPEHHVAH